MTSYHRRRLRVRHRQKTRVPAAPRFASVLGAVVAAGVSAPIGLTAQMPSIGLDVRAGGYHSTPLTEVEIVVPGDEPSEIETMDLTTGFTPFVEVGLVGRLSPLITAELRFGVTSGGLRGKGPGGSWDAGSVTTLHALAGVGIVAFPGVVLRTSLGKAFLSGSDVQLLKDGEHTGLLVAAGVAYEPRVALPVAIEVDVQRHEFGTPALRRVGGVDGAVRRISLAVRYRIGGRT